MTSHSIDGGSRGGSGYRSGAGLSPAALAGVVIVHAALGAAILSMTAISIFEPKPDPIWVRNIPATPPKSDPAPPKPRPEIVARTPTSPEPTITLPMPQTTEFVPATLPLDPGGITGGTGPVLTPLPTPDPTPPVLAQARPDARFARDFQPPYPAAMLRLQMEGDVTMRVQIGADGRVLDVALVSTADPAFFEAAKRQALARWRFLPATRDGVPVASERVMTVHFRITD